MITITRIGNCSYHNVPRFRVDSKKYGTMTLHLDGDGSIGIRDSKEFLTFNGIEYRCYVTLRTTENNATKATLRNGGEPAPGFNPREPQQEYQMRQWNDVDGTRRNWTDYHKAKLSGAARRLLIAFAEEAAALVPVQALFDAEIQLLESRGEEAEKKVKASRIAAEHARQESIELADRVVALEDLKAGLEVTT